jgi:hypothetical protein
MNQIYLVSNDGRLFQAQQHSNTFELIEDKGTSELVRLKRVASSPWCLWCVSAQFELHLYAFLLDTPYEFQEVTYENQVSAHKCNALIGKMRKDHYDHSHHGSNRFNSI